MYKLEKTSTSLYMQLYLQIKEDIKNNSLKGKLPSIRKMSSDYKISKNTVEAAYNQLYVEGYIYSKPQSGYFVNEEIYTKLKIQKPLKTTKEEKQKKYKYDFYQAKLSNDIFPKKLWAKLYNKVIKEEVNFFEYPNRQGDIGLREEIAKYLASSRAVNCSSEQIVIASGFSDIMFIIANLFKEYTNHFAIEYPGYKVAKKVFELMSYNIEEIAITKEGINLELLKNIKAKLLYVTPSHQYPTGVTIPISNRIKLISWAEENNSYIIEDDYDSELSYYNRPIPSLQGINNNQRVIYIGTFSKAFSPALRVSYLVLPKCLIERYIKTFDFSYSGTCINTQKTLELFLKEGFWERHLRKVRTLNKKKHDLMKEFLLKYLKDSFKIIREGSGLTILIQAKLNIDFEKLQDKAIEKNIKIYLYTYKNTILISMGFGGFKEEEIEKAVIAFSKIWFECINL
ncbi:PLP-dependent aminotransferase family protein [Malaciobacter mytili]|uniref:MocR-like pyridoxine biosynthesis transcription factor PdxR n=2 Tax=Malaciobacter mytili TaxID=603050 RepID=UPI003BAF5BD1